MIRAKSKFKKLVYDFEFFRVRLSMLHRINKLLRLAAKQIDDVFLINGERKGTLDEWLYRSIIYTLFYSNFMSVSMIAQQEKVRFNYIDTKLLLRAIIERCVTQKYILIDPRKNASLFDYWATIETKRFHTSRETLQQLNSDSLALNIDFEGEINKWTNERETEYQEDVSKWESLVQPKQEASKAKSWSGHSLAEMARLTGLEDLYRLTYRETSWYSHGLFAVSDFYTQPDKNGVKYTSSPSNLQMIECYMQTEKLFSLSFSIAAEALEWDVSQQIKKITESHYSTTGWMWEFIRIFIF